ncbi:DUF7696 family protein [Undibacterium crateris]
MRPFNLSEQYRHECEVRLLCRMRLQSRKSSEVSAYLELVGKRRGEEAKGKLNGDFVQQFSMGNVGKCGVWLEAKNVLA